MVTSQLGGSVRAESEIGNPDNPGIRWGWRCTGLNHETLQIDKKGIRREKPKKSPLYMQKMFPEREKQRQALQAGKNLLMKNSAAG
jgi:hypothetical protein